MEKDPVWSISRPIELYVVRCVHSIWSIRVAFFKIKWLQLAALCVQFGFDPSWFYYMYQDIEDWVSGIFQLYPACSSKIRW